MPRNGEASGYSSKSSSRGGWLHEDNVIMNEGVTFDVRVSSIVAKKNQSQNLLYGFWFPLPKMVSYR